MKYLITAAALALALVATASAAYPTKPNRIRGPICANRHTGVMRWVMAHQACKKHEVRLMVPKRLRGLQGKPGIAGPQGATGAKGDTGAQGPRGAAGATGLGLSGIVSAKAQECANGGWILRALVFGNFAVCNGKAGADGAQGPAGADGAPGETGATGSAGPAGLTGPAGQDGAPGANGATGAAGTAGQDGALGATGPDGPQGPAGPKGDTGPQGPEGPKGDTGATGPPGLAGIDGSSLVEVSGSSSTIDANETVTATADCGPGKTAISGGFAETGATSPSVIESRRLSDGSGWVSKAKTQGGSQQGLTLTTYAYCVASV
jgi:hypothetical protein